MKKTGLFFLHLIAAAVLTVLTQIGGVIYVASLFIRAGFKLKGLVSFGIFLGIYAVSTFVVVPLVAPYFGRVPLPINSNLKPLTIASCVLNRHYVTPVLKEQLVAATEIMNDKFPGTTVNYLDANFPFFNGFPLIPHLSHGDGEKVDFAFFYNDRESGEKTNRTPSFIGYGAFDGPKKGEIDYPEKCREEGFVMYNALEFLGPLLNGDKYTVDAQRTTAFIKLLAESQKTSKIFIEPHLKLRWKLNGIDKIRYQGCHSVRHDDHIHMQIF